MLRIFSTWFILGEIYYTYFIYAFTVLSIYYRIPESKKLTAVYIFLWLDLIKCGNHKQKVEKMYLYLLYVVYKVWETQISHIGALVEKEQEEG